MTRSKTLLSALGVGLVLAVGVPTAVSAVGGPSTQATPDRGQNGNARPVERQCAYPPSRTSNLALSASGGAAVRAGSTVTLLGQQAANGCPVKQSSLTLYSSATQNGTYTPVTTAGATQTTDDTGNAAFTVTVARTTFFKLYYTGDTNLDPVTSNAIRITVSNK